ncbi:MAG: DNA-binding protein [Nannocystaceae bacterium]|nr:DNA-binding protein [Nannocystaceae bacterium]
MLVHDPPSNLEIAAAFDEVADLLEARGEDGHRARAYREGARTLRAQPSEVAELVHRRGRAGLLALPGIGRRLAAVIEGYVTTGRFDLLERMVGEAGPEELFTLVPGIGPELAERIHRELAIDTLEELELAAHDGRLDALTGMGPRRVRAIRDTLDAMLRRSTRRRARLVGARRSTTSPPLALLLEIDREYRERAKAGSLPTIAPRRFNPEHERWLPMLHTHRAGWDFDAMFSNTARAHQLGKTRDWVVIYFGRSGDEGQCTVVTEGSGALAGHRVVRGREHEALEALAAAAAPRAMGQPRQLAS